MCCTSPHPFVSPQEHYMFVAVSCHLNSAWYGLCGAPDSLHGCLPKYLHAMLGSFHREVVQAQLGVDRIVSGPGCANVLYIRGLCDPPILVSPQHVRCGLLPFEFGLVRVPP